MPPPISGRATGRPLASPAPEPARCVTGDELRLRAGDRRFPDAANGRGSSRFTIRSHHLQPVGSAFNWPFGAALSVILSLLVMDRRHRARQLVRAPDMMKLSRLAYLGLSALTAVVFLLLYGPLLVPIASSFFEVAHGNVQWDRPSLSAYAALAHNEGIITASPQYAHRRLRILLVCARSPITWPKPPTRHLRHPRPPSALPAYLLLNHICIAFCSCRGT